jgi:hypothetical protein
MLLYCINATLYKFSTLTSVHLARPMILNINVLSTFENIVFTSQSANRHDGKRLSPHPQAKKCRQ